MIFRPILATDGDLMLADGGAWDDAGKAALASTTSGTWKAMEGLETVWTALRDGLIVGVGGLIPLWPGTGKCFAIFHGRIKPTDFLAIHRHTVSKLDIYQTAYGFKRAEMAVDCDFAKGVRWAKLLGFKVEGVMQAYVNGRDHYLFSRIR